MRAGQCVPVGGQTATPRPRPRHRDTHAGLPRSRLLAAGGQSRPMTPTPLTAPGAPGRGEPAALHHHAARSLPRKGGPRGVPDGKAPATTGHSPGSPGSWSRAATWPVRWVTCGRGREPAQTPAPAEPRSHQDLLPASTARRGEGTGAGEQGEHTRHAGKRAGFSEREMRCDSAWRLLTEIQAVSVRV